MITLSEIREIHIELTTRCNASCPQCPRNYFGFDYNGGYPVTELALPQIQKILLPDFLSQITEVQLNGNLGDFGSAKQGPEIVRYLLDSGVKKIIINSNASMRSSEWWAQLALPGVEVHFAIDGLADTHQLYRQNTNWHRVIDHAKAFIAAGGRAVWQFIPFDHNRHQESACRKLARDLGFVDFFLNDQGRDSGPVFDRSGKLVRWLRKDPGPDPDVNDLIHMHETWFDPATVPDDTHMEISCMTKNLKTIYLAADGTVYPCCYLGFYPDSMKHPGNSQIKPLIENNNALIHGLEASLNWFHNVEHAWNHATIAQGRPYICVQSCGKCAAKT